MIAFLAAAALAAPPQVYDGVLLHPATDVIVPRVGTLGMARFAGTGGTLASGRTPSDLWVTGGIGLALVRSLFPGRGISGFPAVAVAMERGTPVGRLWIGVDSSPLLLQAGNGAFWHIALVSGGLTTRGPHLRGGPYAAAGLVGLAGGWRVVFAPFEGQGGSMRGFEARLAATVGPGAEGPVVWQEPAGEAMFLYTGTFQLGRTEGRWDPRPVVVESGPPQEDLLTCRRLTLGLGAAVGASSTRLSWEYIGSSQRAEISGSPMASAACETGSANVGLLVSAESAPLFHYRVPWDDQGSDQLASHLGSASLGPVFGSATFRVAPIVQAGIWTLGGGLRVALTPIRDAAGRRHGLEARAVALWPSAPSGEAVLLYTVSLDPRRGVGDGS